MGIPGFNRWLLSNFPEIVRVQSIKASNVYDHVAFDLNQILHQAARRATSRPSFASAIFRELDQILHNCQPRKSVYFAFDGPAPLAKLVTQRKRRNKSSAEYVMFQKKGKATKTKSGGPNAAKTIDRLELTPGVDLMYHVRDAIEYWSYSRLQKDSAFADLTIHISGVDVPGEGELKIMDYCHVGGCVDTNDSVVVVGGDADIILQSLATTSVKNLFIYLRKYEGVNTKYPKNYVLSVWELVRSFEKLFPGESSRIRIDFILLSIINGNDYLPKLRGSSLKNLWRRYRVLKTKPSEDGKPPAFHNHFLLDARNRTLNWPFFYALIHQSGHAVSIQDALLENELNRLETEEEAVNETGVIEAEGGDNGPTGADDNEDVEDDDFDETVKESDIEEDALHDSEYVSDSTLSTLSTPPEDPDEQHIRRLMAMNGNDNSKYFDTEGWCRTLLWTIHMYIDGYCSDYSFRYGKPYAPNADMLSKYIRENDADPFNVCAPVSKTPPLLPHATALAVLPYRASHLLPQVLQKHALPDHLIDSEGTEVLTRVSRALDDITPDMYRMNERRRTIHGEPFALAVATGKQGLRVPGMVPMTAPERLAAKFPRLGREPRIVKGISRRTSSPPCLQWPNAHSVGTLQEEYLIAGGRRLKLAVEKETAEPSGNEIVGKLLAIGRKNIYRSDFQVRRDNSKRQWTGDDSRGSSSSSRPNHATTSSGTRQEPGPQSSSAASSSGTTNQGLRRENWNTSRGGGRGGRGNGRRGEGGRARHSTRGGSTTGRSMTGGEQDSDGRSEMAGDVLGESANRSANRDSDSTQRRGSWRGRGRGRGRGSGTWRGRGAASGRSNENVRRPTTGPGMNSAHDDHGTGDSNQSTVSGEGL